MYLFEDQAKMFTFLKDRLESGNLNQAQIALEYAIEKHKNQTRKDGKAYIIHPLTMACNSFAMGMQEEDLISTILLHDVCEDCGVSAEDLPVNEKVKRSVRLLTFEKGDDESYGEAKHRYFTNIAVDEKATIVKLMDRCHNISTMSQAFTVKKMKSYIAETREYVLGYLYREAKARYPQYDNQLFLIKYHLGSVVDSVENVVSLCSTNR